MKKIFACLTIVIFLFSARSVGAHFLSTDKNIGAVLHVDPGDEPKVGEQTSFFFEFKDKDNNFDPKSCECKFVISENGKSVYEQPLFKNISNPSLTNGAVFYTFSKKGAYEIKISGKPIVENKFKSFNLRWNLRVVPTESSSNSKGVKTFSFFSLHFIHLIIFGAGVVVFLYLIKNNS